MMETHPPRAVEYKKTLTGVELIDVELQKVLNDQVMARMAPRKISTIDGFIYIYIYIYIYTYLY